MMILLEKLKFDSKIPMKKKMTKKFILIRLDRSAQIMDKEV